MNAMKQAWNIRREAAKRWNCTVNEIIFSECLKMAHAGQRVPKKMSKEEQLRNHPAVESFGEFQVQEKGIDRLYLNLRGKNKGWNGDRNVKIYWDRKTQQLVFQSGKGYRSNEFQASIDQLDETVGFDQEK